MSAFPLAVDPFAVQPGLPLERPEARKRARSSAEDALVVQGLSVFDVEQQTLKPAEIIDMLFVKQSAPLGKLQHTIYNIFLGLAYHTMRSMGLRDWMNDNVPRVFSFNFEQVAAVCGYSSNGEGDCHDLKHFFRSAEGLMGRYVALGGREIAINGELPKPKRGRKKAVLRTDAKEGWVHLVSGVYRDGENLLVEFPLLICQCLLSTSSSAVNVPWNETDALPSRSSAVLYEFLLLHRKYDSVSVIECDWRTLSVWLSGEVAPHSSFKSFNKMFERALDAAQSRIKTHAIAVERRKIGKTVQSLVFVLTPHASEISDLTPVADRASDAILAEMIQLGVQDSMCRMMRDQYSGDVIERNLSYAKRQFYKLPKGQQKNLGGYIVSCIKNDYDASDRRKRGEPVAPVVNRPAGTDTGAPPPALPAPKTRMPVGQSGFPDFETPEVTSPEASSRQAFEDALRKGGKEVLLATIERLAPMLSEFQRPVLRSARDALTSEPQMANVCRYLKQHKWVVDANGVLVPPASS